MKKFIIYFVLPAAILSVVIMGLVKPIMIDAELIPAERHQNFVSYWSNQLAVLVKGDAIELKNGTVWFVLENTSGHIKIMGNDVTKLCDISVLAGKVARIEQPRNGMMYDYLCRHYAGQVVSNKVTSLE